MTLYIYITRRGLLEKVILAAQLDPFMSVKALTLRLKPQIEIRNHRQSDTISDNEIT